MTLPPLIGPGRKFGWTIKEGQIAKKRHTTEEVIGKLREAEVLLSQGRSVAEAAKSIGVTGQSYYRWRREYGGLKSDQASRLAERRAQRAPCSIARR